MLKDKKYSFVCRDCGESWNESGEPDGDCPSCDGLGKITLREGTCDCGNRVEFSNFTNTCEKCGADYDMSGNLLAPRQQWGEETGETASDIMLGVNEDDIFDAVDTSIEDLSVSDDEEEVVEEPKGEIAGKLMVQVDDEEPVEYSFTLPAVPGAADAQDLEDVTVEEEKPAEPKDMWDWGSDIKGVFPWLQNILSSVPKHSGTEILGIERAIAYLENAMRYLSKAVRMDLKDELDIKKIEEARDEIQNGIDRLNERKDSLLRMKGKKKKAEEEGGEIVKEAQKIWGVHGVMVTVPLLISRIARVCINGMVSGGHDIEDLYKKQVKAYNLTIREQAELLQLLEDTGYPVRRDRGLLPDEEIDRTRSDNYDWNANYNA